MENQKNCPKDKGIGGQAVIEGVMMRGKGIYALAVRNVNTKEIEIFQKKLDITKRNRFLKLPIIRGVVAFIDSLIIGMRVIMKSAQMSGLDEETEEEKQKEKTKFEKWLTNKFGDKLTDIIIYFSVFLSIIISVSLFMLLPVWISSQLNKFLEVKTFAIGIIEGFVRIFIFLLYLFLVSKTKDVKRTFMYHGAEHKTINCFESGDDLTVENVKNHTKLHKRCGTSFIIIVMIVSMIVFLFINTNVIFYRFLSRIILVPFIAGISYEIIKWAGRSDSSLVNIISKPGFMMQGITTIEPTDDMIEVAIASLQCVLKNGSNS